MDVKRSLVITIVFQRLSSHPPNSIFHSKVDKTCDSAADHNPLHNVIISTLAAIFPLIILLTSIVFLKMKAHRAAGLGLLSALLVAIATRHLVNRSVIEALGQDGVLINIARGTVVDEPVLVEALVEGRLGGAGLDVFADEPRVPGDLFALEQRRASIAPGKCHPRDAQRHGRPHS